MISFSSLPDVAPAGPDGDAPAAPRAPTGSAGFGAPGADRTVRRIDLNEALIRHPQATYLMRAAGSAMQGAGIADGDVLLVDRALTPQHGQVVIAVVEGELVCRRLCSQGAVKLQAACAGHPDIRVDEDRPLEVWGVVTTVIKSLLA